MVVYTCLNLFTKGVFESKIPNEGTWDIANSCFNL